MEEKGRGERKEVLVCLYDWLITCMSCTVHAVVACT